MTASGLARKRYTFVHEAMAKSPEASISMAFGQDVATEASKSIRKEGFDMNGIIELSNPVIARILQISSGPSTV